MADRIGELVAQVVADTTQFRTEMRELAGIVASNTAQINRQLSTVGKASSALAASFRLITQAAGLFGIALSARAIVNFASQTLEGAKQLKNLSDRLGVSVESLSELQYVAKLTDVDFGRLTQSVQFMVRQLGEAQRRSGGARQAFADLGINFRDIINLPVDQQLAAVAEALSNTTGQARKLTLAQRVFGRGSAEMLQLVKDGADGINKLTQEARDLGITLSTGAARDAAAASDQIDRMTSSFNALAREIVTNAAPQLERILTFWHQIIFPPTSQFGRQADEISEKVQQAVEEVERLQRLLGTQSAYNAEANWFQRMVFGTVDVTETTAQLKAAREELVKLREQRDIVLGIKPDPEKKPTPEPEPEDEGFPFAKEMAAIRQSARATNRIAENQAMNDAILMSQQELEDDLANLDWKALQRATDIAEAQMQLAQDSADREIALREGVASASIGFLQAVGSEHRGAAIAALVLQKALALKQIFFSGQVQARAEAAHAAIAGGPAAAAAAYARVMGQVKLQMALVAATGLIEAGQLSHGGMAATRGTSANPLITRASSSAPTGASATARQKGVQIIFQGDVFGWDESMRRKVVESLRDLIDNKDVVIFGPNSRQAIEILGR